MNEFLFSVMISRGIEVNYLLNQFQPCVASNLETNNLFYNTNQMTGFYMKYNTGLKCAKFILSSADLAFPKIFKSTMYNYNTHRKHEHYAFNPLLLVLPSYRNQCGFYMRATLAYNGLK